MVKQMQKFKSINKLQFNFLIRWKLLLPCWLAKEFATFVIKSTGGVALFKINNQLVSPSGEVIRR
jgi:hypothetical protein